MTIKINDCNINCIQYGMDDGQDVVLLHGWGQNIEMMDPLGKGICNIAKVTIIDLPGYGGSDEPKEPLYVSDYAFILHQLFEQLKIKNPILVGHSFGGRIAIVYASKYETKKLVLLGSPIKKSTKSDSLKVKTLKSLKKVPGLKKLENFAKKHIGSTDYRNASVIMRQILVNTVNEDLTVYVKEIKRPTIIIWGENDTEASMEDAKELERLIPDSGLIVYENCTHYAYLERLGQTISIINEFIK